MKRDVVETQDKTDEFASALEQLRFLQGSRRYLIAWPLAAIVIAALMWWLVLSHLDTEREYLRSQAYAEAQSLARSYADQLGRTVEHIDQITLNLAHYWKESGGRLRLEAQVDKGLYPNDPDFSVSIFDRDGSFRTSLLPHPAGASVQDRAYFQAQRERQGHGLQIQRVDQARILGKPAIVFSRGLTDAAQRFDGIVCISVPPPFLASFYEKAAEGENDVMAVVDEEGHVLASKRGRGLRNGRTLLRVAPVFHSARGVTLAPAQDFQDGRARIVAWDTAEKYRLVSVVALSEEDALAPYIAQSRDYKGMAVAASFLLLVISVIGSALTARLAWRKHHESVVAETYRLAIEGAREGFFMARALIGRDHKITDFVVENCNEQGAAMLGLKKVHLVGVRFSQLYPDRLFARVMAVFCHVMETGFAEDEFRMRRPDAPEAPAWMHRRLVRSGAGIAVTLRDITDAKSHELSLQTLANTDSLTNLPNRYWLHHHLPQAIELAARRHAKLAVLYLDLDDFKNVNNTLGHDAGDQVLRQAGHRIQSVLRPGDQAVRLGGDEFTVLIAGLETPAELAPIAGRILEVLSRPFLLADGSEAALNASVGISLYPEDGACAEALLQHADTAMYAAKHAGKGRFAFYASELTDRILERIGAERDLRMAVDAGQFTLFYQPRVNATTGRLVSMEALVRWLHPERGIVAPSEFIPLAEETGLIAGIGATVIDQACAQLAAWKLRGLDAVPLSVNVSPMQFARGDLVETLAASAARHGIAPAMLELEITESCMMHDHDKVAQDIAALKAMGVRISVDDFGTGYSSLSQLQRMDLDVLKVDRAFTSQLSNGRHGEAFFMTIVSMAHILNMQVVAEGVETVEQLSILRLLGCNEIQGYLVSRPVCAEEATAFLSRKSLLSERERAFEPA